MRTDARSRMARYLLAISVLTGGAAHAQAQESMVSALDRWRQSSRPLLVVVALNGLQSDLVAPTTAEGEPLMPNLMRIVRPTEPVPLVWSGSPLPASGLAQLLTGASPLDGWNVEPAARGVTGLIRHGFQIHVMGEANTSNPPLDVASFASWETLAGDPIENARRIERHLRQIIAAQSPSVFVVASDALVAPFDIPRRWLPAYDPQPWQGGDRMIDLQRLQRGHLLRVERAATMNGDALANLRDATATWLETAAHAFNDSLMTGWLRALETPDVDPRLALVVTALRGPDRGTPLSSDSHRVPMFVRVAGTSFAPPDGADLGWFARALDAAPLAPTADVFTVDPRPASAAMAWRTSTFSLVSPTRGPAMLFDRTWDPDEHENLANLQRAPIQALRKQLPTVAWGDNLELQLCVVGSDTPRELLCPLPETDARTRGGAENNELMGDGQRVQWKVLADPSPRAVRLNLTSTAGGLGPVEGDWPIFLGQRAWPATGRRLRWQAPDFTWLQAYVARPTVDQLEWVQGRPAGLYVWIVPQTPPRRINTR